MTDEVWEPIRTDALADIRDLTLALAEVGTFRYRLDGTVVYMDAGLVRILDLGDLYPDPALLTGKNLRDLLIYESAEGSLRDLVLRKGRIRNYEFKCRTLQGDLRWSLHEAFTVRDAETGEICIQVVARNITELKEKEEKLEQANRELADLRDNLERQVASRTSALSESEARFRAVSEGSLTGVYIVQGGCLTYVNPALAATFGYEVGELIGVDPLVLIDPDDRDLVRENIRRRMTGEVGALHYEFRGRRKDGTLLALEVIGGRVELEGQPAVIGNIVDLTERHRAETLLRESELRYHALFENANDAILLIADGRFVDCNSGAMKVFGCARERIIGAHPDELSPAMQPDGSSSVAKAAQKITRALAGEPQRFEWEHLRADGTTFAAEVSLNRVELGGKLNLMAIVRNVTERKRAELAVKDSEERFRSVVELSPSGIVIHEGGRITYANPAVAGILGAENPALLVGRLTRDFVHPDYLARAQERVRRVTETGQVEPPEETVYLRLDGTPVNVESAAVAVTIGGRAAVVVVISDISERKRADERLRASETRYRVLFDQMISGLIVLEVILDDNGNPCDHRLLYANPAFEALTGLKVAEQMGKTRDELDINWPPDVRERLYRVAMTGEPIHYERFNESLGRYYETHVFAPQHGQFAFSFTEITERKAAEEELRKLSRAVEQTQASVVITNLKAEIEYVNESFVRRTGYSRDEVVGQNPRILNSGETPRATYDALWQALARGDTWAGEFVNRKKDGSTYIEQVVISPLRQPDGTVTHYVAVKEDVTEQKRLLKEVARHRDHLVELVAEQTMELVQAREQAEAANTAKSTFLATMSHEIRTPLNGVIAMAEMLALRPLAPDDLDAARTIERSAHNLMAIINDVLDFSKIEAGKMDLEVTDVSLRQVASDVRISLQPVADAGAVDLAVDVDPDLPVFVRGDATRLRQVVMNLMGNAIKFSRGRPGIRGQVSVRFERNSRRKRGVVIRVSDNGIGMSQETIGRLFTSFSQAERSTTRRFGGTGLGLAICKRLVDLMDGTIEVTSEPGHGATFTVTLPLQRSTATPQSTAIHTGADTAPRPLLHDTPLTIDEARAQGRLILVAEDESMNQKVIRRQLGLVGYAAEVAADGLEALRLWRQGGHAMLLTDLQMPNMDGYELAATIRSEEPAGVHLPIIALTANALRGEAERVTSIGMDGYVTKPVSLATLREVLDRWTAARRVPPRP